MPGGTAANDFGVGNRPLCDVSRCLRMDFIFDVKIFSSACACNVSEPLSRMNLTPNAE